MLVYVITHLPLHPRHPPGGHCALHRPAPSSSSRSSSRTPTSGGRPSVVHLGLDVTPGTRACDCNDVAHCPARHPQPASAATSRHEYVRPPCAPSSSSPGLSTTLASSSCPIPDACGLSPGLHPPQLRARQHRPLQRRPPKHPLGATSASSAFAACTASLCCSGSAAASPPGTRASSTSMTTRLRKIQDRTSHRRVSRAASRPGPRRAHCACPLRVGTCRGGSLLGFSACCSRLIEPPRVTQLCFPWRQPWCLIPSGRGPSLRRPSVWPQSSCVAGVREAHSAACLGLGTFPIA